jgi:predicted membrane-bound spermidine synthase
MGMTLPLMCRVVIGHDGLIGRHLAWLYGANTLGAAVGALLSSYLLIGLFGLDGAALFAAALNFGLAAVVCVIAAASAKAVAKHAATPPELRRPAAAIALDYRGVLVFSFLSGFIALGYEIVWYRILGVLLHGTVYVFGTILFFYLAGIATGSLLARKRIDEGRCIERFALSQLAIAAYAFLLFSMLGRLSWLPPLRELIAASFFTTFHPSPELIAGHIDLFSLYSLFDVGIWSILILGLPTVLMGYGFTNLMREGIRNVETLGHSVGGVYFANIAGSTIGSLLVGFVVIHYFGSERALQMLIVAGTTIPLLLFAAAMRRHVRSNQLPQSLLRRWGYLASALALLAAFAFPSRSQVIKAIHFADQPGVEFIGAEDRTGISVLRLQRTVVAFSQEATLLGQQRLYIDGSHHGDGSEVVGRDVPVEVALAAHQAPRRVLSIGLGDAHMAATAVLSPAVDELVVVELNGNLNTILRRTPQGKAVLESGKVRYVIDDGRRWLLANPGEKFDVIMMFPLHAAHAFSGSLYSIEFLQLLRTHLRDSGIVLLRTADMFSTARTIATAFPRVIRLDGIAYIAGASSFTLDRARLPFSVEEAAERLDADREVILAHTQNARLNRDFGPNSEYYVTYPFAASLQTRVRNPMAYRANDRNLVNAILGPRPPGVTD